MRTRSIIQIFVIVGAIIITALSWTLWRPAPPVRETPEDEKPFNQTGRLEQAFFASVNPEERFYPEEIKANYLYNEEDGHHYLSGVIAYPEPCMLSRVHVNVSDEDKIVKVIFLGVNAPKEKEEGCELTYPQNLPWTSSIRAPKDYEIKAIFNEREIPLVLIPD